MWEVGRIGDGGLEEGRGFKGFREVTVGTCCCAFLDASEGFKAQCLGRGSDGRRVRGSGVAVLGLVGSGLGVELLAVLFNFWCNGGDWEGCSEALVHCAVIVFINGSLGCPCDVLG